MHHTFRTSFTILSLGLLAACSGTKKGPGTTDPYADVASFCTQWASAACNSTVVSQCHAPSTKDCETAQAAFCESLIPANYDSQYAKQCIDAVKSAYKDAKITRSEFATVRELAAPCNQLIKGPGQVGGVCSSNNDCNTLDGLACVFKTSPVSSDAGTDAGAEAGADGGGTAKAGTCQKPVTVGAGYDCTGAGDVCISGFYCGGGHCIASGKEGEPCSVTSPCGSDLDCQNGQCVAKAGENGNCTTDADCQDTLLCAPTATGQGVCVTERELSLSDPLCSDLR